MARGRAVRPQRQDADCDAMRCDAVRLVGSRHQEPVPIRYCGGHDSIWKQPNPQPIALERAHCSQLHLSRSAREKTSCVVDHVSPKRQVAQSFVLKAGTAGKHNRLVNHRATASEKSPSVLSRPGVRSSHFFQNSACPELRC